MELWRTDYDEQELTYYKRFANILDVSFKGPKVILAE
jgi:hypothetical protein